MKFGSIAIIASSMLGLALGKTTPEPDTAVASPVPTPGVIPGPLDGLVKPLDPFKLLDPLTTLTKRIADQAIQDSRLAKRQVQGLSYPPDDYSAPNPFEDLDISKLASGPDMYMKAAQPLLDLLGLGGLTKTYEDAKKKLDDMLTKWKDEYDQKASSSSKATSPSAASDSTSTPAA